LGFENFDSDLTTLAGDDIKKYQFLTGQYGLKTRLDEITFPIENSGTEIDIVINRQLALIGDWKGLYNEVREMRKVCGDRAHMKTILAIGELGTMENV